MMKRNNGTLTSDPKEMRMLTMDFYKDLFEAYKCDVSSMDFFLKDIQIYFNWILNNKRSWTLR